MSHDPPPTPEPIDLNHVEKNEHRYPPFPPAVRSQIEHIQHTFAEVWPDTVEE